ncbi:MAG: diacylglycerol/lipid kinase family protein [Cyclobacteriaceae bacterium]
MQERFKKIRLIINPAAGGSGFNKIIRKLSRIKSSVHSEIETIISENPGDITLFCRQFADEHHPVFVSGGDGSVHEAAIGLKGSEAPLAILPTGSGNGLARHLKIPVKLKKAVNVLVRKSKQIKADMPELNGQPFVNVGGIGFDGLVACTFNNAGKRGLITYVQKIFTNYLGSGQFDYKISFEDQHISGKAWLIALANSSEYGNGAKISPGSLVTDGLLDLVIVRKPGLLQIPVLLYQVMSGRVNSDLIKRYKIKKCSIELNEKIDYHLDGEYLGKIQNASCTVIPSCLNLLVPLSARSV